MHDFLEQPTQITGRAGFRMLFINAFVHLALEVVIIMLFFSLTSGLLDKPFLEDRDWIL